MQYYTFLDIRHFISNFPHFVTQSSFMSMIDKIAIIWQFGSYIDPTARRISSSLMPEE